VRGVSGSSVQLRVLITHVALHQVINTVGLNEKGVLENIYRSLIAATANDTKHTVRLWESDLVIELPPLKPGQPEGYR
jgi:hypothetical protein